MPDRNDIQWFKTQFQARIAPALAGTPLTVDLLTAIACQETGEVWPLLRRKNLDEPTLLSLCVGDTLDADKGRRAFPRTRADLIAFPQGEAMFALAHQALVRPIQQHGGQRRVRPAEQRFDPGAGDLHAAAVTSASPAG